MLQSKRAALLLLGLLLASSLNAGPQLNVPNVQNFFSANPTILVSGNANVPVMYLNCALCEVFYHASYVTCYAASTSAANVPSLVFDVHACVASAPGTSTTAYVPCAMTHYGFPIAPELLAAVDSAIAVFGMPLFYNVTDANSSSAFNSVTSAAQKATTPVKSRGGQTADVVDL